MPAPLLHIVHCIDTEGPLSEPLAATFERLHSIFGLRLPPTHQVLLQLQNREMDLGGIEAEVSQVVRPDLLAYNQTWGDIETMLEQAMSPPFRNEMLDSSGKGWVYSWHLMDHVGYSCNPREKALGYGAVFDYYKTATQRHAADRDELNWHFHPLFPDGDPLKAATSYTNSYPQLNQILCRRLIDHGWFPTSNRPGFHSERPDSNAFLEQWMPFDYANQSYETDSGQADLRGGRFGDWRRAPRDWLGYHPSMRDYQTPGELRRHVFRCLNVGTRFRELNAEHFEQAFTDATTTGSAVLAFADHDYRDIRPDVRRVREMLKQAMVRHPQVQLRFSGASAAAREHLHALGRLAQVAPLQLSMGMTDQTLHVRCNSGECFGPQPFLALRTTDGRYIHDNLDVQTPEKHWTYVLDAQTVPPTDLQTAAVGSAGSDGSVAVVHLTP